MLIKIDLVDPQGQLRTFAFSPSRLEYGFSTLSQIVMNGNTLITAQLMSNGNFTSLPTEAFDGELFTEPIQLLETEWQLILSKPLLSLMTLEGKQQTITSIERRLISCQSHIKNLDTVIQRTNDLLNYSSQHEHISERFKRLHQSNQLAMNFFQKQLRCYHLIEGRVRQLLET